MGGSIKPAIDKAIDTSPNISHGATSSNMTSTIEGIKISNIYLMNPRVRTPGGDPKFHINIKFAGKITTNTKTEKKALNGDRVVWDESFSFPGVIADSLVILEVFKTHWLSTKLVGSLKEKVSDLIQLQTNTGSCKHEIGDKNCHLVFRIEPQSDVLSSVLSETPRSSDLSRVEIPAKIAGVILSAHETLSDQEDTWSAFLSKFQIFMNTMDKVADIHPYATFAWGILSIIPKTIMTYKNRNDSVKQLCEKLKEMYDFITDAERLPKLSQTQDDVLAILIQQTIECGYFIRDYSKENIAGKLWEGANIDNKVEAFINKFDHLRKVMTDSVVLETSIVTLRVSESVNEIKELTLLSEMPYARDAGFVSGKRCLPGTRQHLIQDIIDWVNQDTLERVLVLSGAAGTGKSAVAHTIADIFRKQNRLGSLFCFNRSYKERRNFLFSTISREMADSDVVWRRSLTNIIDQTSIRTSTDMTTQFKELIAKPSKGISTIGPVVIVIDALDESGDLEDRQPLLDILFTQTSVLPSNYRIILTSRPEQDVESQCKKSTIPCKRMGNINADETFLDIQSCIAYRLKPLAQVLNKIEGEWSYILAKRAEGLFQWADTACRFINPNIRNPSIIERRWKFCISSSSSSLYQLYHQIISGQEETQDEQFLSDFKLIVGAIMTAREPLSVDALQNIFQDIILDVKTTLDPFGSLFPGVHDIYAPVRPLHTSLLDFFHEQNQDVKNENKFYVNTSDHRMFTLGCLKVMNRMLHFNICDLETSHRRNQDLPEFDSRVKKAIPFHLSYACRFWAFHLRYSTAGDDLLTQIRIMIDDNLLYFFEVLGLLSEVDRGRVGMEILEVWCKSTHEELITQVRDAWQFLFEFGEAFAASTPHLYISALPFVPEDSFVSKRYLPQYPQLVGIEGNYPSNSGVKTGIVKRNALRSPTSLAFSSLGTYVATGFDNGEFWFWDYKFGEMVYQWKPRQDLPHRIFISDIVFSPDEELVYCCFADGLIRIWNPSTKETAEESYQEILEHGCSKCTISSDGCYIAFVRIGAFLLYDRKACRKLLEFRYPLNILHYETAVFSPNGKWLAFNQDENVICLWSTHRQETVKTWTAFNIRGLSLSNKYIALTRTGITQVWDIETISKVNEFETKGYLVCFISDQYLLALVYECYSIWNITTGELVIKSSVESNIMKITLSPDSQFIALGTDDGTVHVRQWDTCNQSTPLNKVERMVSTNLWRQGHYLVQHSMVRAIDDLLRISAVKTRNSIILENRIAKGHFVAVSPRDDYVRVAYITTLGLVVWDNEKGETVLNESESHITSFEFSPDGNFLFSLNLDGVIKAWDVNTYQLSPASYTVPGRVNTFAFSVLDDSFLIAYTTRSGPPNGISFVEDRELKSGRILKGPFECLEFPGFVAFSANETRIVCAARPGIEILDASTGLRESFYANMTFPVHHTLSPDRNYIAWLTVSNEVKLWDIYHAAAPQAVLANGSVDNYFFSDDSAQLITHATADGVSIDIWDLSTGKATKKALPIYGDISQSSLLPFDGNHLVFAPHHIPTILNLDLHKTMSFLYDHYRDHSQFGMFPVDHPGTEGSVQALTSSTSEDKQDLEYALTAWNKALFSTDAKITDDGWMLGPHDELLLWIPDRRRNTLWRPCMVHMTTKYFTKLNFNKFVHGSRWMECGANP